ncbi:MAG TPA: NRDE family protein [Alphaproteobacteria bacterium]|nr:NRDE family protein [Alphaproteobacteria bacterium]
MCSVIILYRPGHDWPLLWASNRDEMADRPWSAPARHWPDRPDVVAGRDDLAGGTWLGMNDTGVVAGVLNRRNTLGPQPGKRSRGELALDALDFPDAADAVDMLLQLDAHAFRPFNMVVADNRDAFWLRNLGQKVEAEKLPPGLSMVTASDRNDLNSRRIGWFLPRWQAAAVPDPLSGDWRAWEELLCDRGHDPSGTVFDAMSIVSNTGFGTVSSSLIGLPAPQFAARRPVWRFIGGRPDKASVWTSIEV